MVPKKINPIMKWLGSANNLITLASAIFMAAIAIMYAGWDFSDRWQKREREQSEFQQHQSDQRQAYFLRQIWKKDLDSLMGQFNRNTTILMEQSIKKDSLLLVVIPVMSSRINRQNNEIEKLNQKFRLIIKGQEQSQQVDFIRVLNERDSIAADKARRDSLDLVLLREIRKINYNLLRDEPKFGDRAR